jgi:hypothetical protein
MREIIDAVLNDPNMSNEDALALASAQAEFLTWT